MGNGSRRSATPEQRADAFAQEHRKRLPGLLDTLILTGSAVLGDWQPGHSDVDLAMIIARPMARAELAVAAQLHAETKASNAIDGLYLTEDQLDAGPDEVVAAPQVVGGELVESQSGGELTWVTWLEIERGIESPVTDEGARHWAPSERRFPAAMDGARRFSRQNLAAYWAPLGARSRGQLSTRSADSPVRAKTVQWIALGPARLLATIETGSVVSKSGAAAFAADRWPEYARILAKAAASRAGEDVTFTVADAVLALDLLDRCVSRDAARHASTFGPAR